MPIGNMRARVAFEERARVDDGAGNPQSGDWLCRHECAAQITPKMGGEAVTASRLQGTQPMLITVRVCSALALIGADWRIRDTRSGVVYDITAISNPDEKRKYLEILGVAGKAT